MSENEPANLKPESISPNAFRDQVATISRPFDFAPRNMDEAFKVAELLSKSMLVPNDYQNSPGNCLVAMMWGAEIGLQALQALQNIAVINKRPSVWGDAALALAYQHPKCVSIEEKIEGEGDDRTATCIAVRSGQAPTVRTFSMRDAAVAGLKGRNTWKTYPDRMLQMRARGFAIRDAFPDALKGLMLAEEVQDLPEREVQGEHQFVEPETRDDAIAQTLAGGKRPEEDVPADKGSVEDTAQSLQSEATAAPEAEVSEAEPTPEVDETATREAEEKATKHYESISESIGYIANNTNANEVLDIINTSELDAEPKRVLRSLVAAKMKQVTAQEK